MNAKRFWCAFVTTFVLSAICVAKNPQQALQAKSSFRFDNVPLKRAVEAISKETDVEIVLTEDVSGDQKVKYDRADQTLKHHLDAMLKPHWLTFSFDDKAIKIYRRTPEDALKTLVDVKFVDTPLSDAALFLGQYHVVRIVLDDDVPEGILIRKVVQNKSLGEVLRQLLNPHKLTYEVKDDTIRIVRVTPATALKVKTDALFLDTPLKDAALFLADYHNITIELDSDVKEFTSIRYQGTAQVFAEFLDAMLKPHNLTYEVKDEKIRIVRQKEKQE